MGPPGAAGHSGAGVNARAWRTAAALALHTAALAALAAALAGSAWLDARSQARVLLLVDRSQSMPRAATDAALADVFQVSQAAGAGAVQVIEFAGRPDLPDARLPPGTAPAPDLQPAATNIESALQAALDAHAVAAVDGVVLISDGLATAGDTARGLAAMQQARLPLQWRAVGSPPPPVRVAEVRAPDTARAGQRIRISVQLAGALGTPARVNVAARHAGGQTDAASALADAAGRAALDIDAGRGGAVVVDVAVQDAASGQTLHSLPNAAAIDVSPPAALLYARSYAKGYAQGGAEGALASSLRRGGWGVQQINATRLDSVTDTLSSYQAVVLDDVALGDASPRLWAALVAAVRERGLGLVVLGGERSFARGGYRGSALESVLPVVSEPLALDEPVSVVFAVDKSGSMGVGQGGVDRFQLAQRAVLETARGLKDSDSMGLLVFDVTPRVLVPLGPVGDGLAALAQAWPASPNGGTRLAPALEAAAAEFARAGRGRRLLVLVTDGFVDDAPLATLRARLAAARIDTLALAVGPDADVAALQRLVGEAAGRVLRVNEAAELPRVMRTGLEQQRARVERGRIAVEQRLPLPFAPGLLAGWPPVAAHAVTRPQPGAVVAVQSERGEPLIAFQSVGAGRVVVVTSSLGAWTPSWLTWREWPALAGGLADWASGSRHGGGLSMTVVPGAGGLQLDVDLPTFATAPAPAPAPSMVIRVDTPIRSNLPLAADAVAPGRLRAALPDDGPGLYSFSLTTPQGTQRLLHLRHQQAETESWGIAPELAGWRRDGLLSDWNPRQPLTAASGARVQRAPDRSLIALALALCLAGVVLDRTRPGAARAAWQRASR
jgi:hypothetical protein